jgi:hypothetical protein
MVMNNISHSFLLNTNMNSNLLWVNRSNENEYLQYTNESEWYLLYTNMSLWYLQYRFCDMLFQDLTRSDSRMNGKYHSWPLRTDTIFSHLPFKNGQ